MCTYDYTSLSYLLIMCQTRLSSRLPSTYCTTTVLDMQSHSIRPPHFSILWGVPSPPPLLVAVPSRGRAPFSSAVRPKRDPAKRIKPSNTPPDDIRISFSLWKSPYVWSPNSYACIGGDEWKKRVLCVLLAKFSLCSHRDAWLNMLRNVDFVIILN